MLIAAAAADLSTTLKPEDDKTQPEKRSLGLALHAYNAVGNKIANLGYLATCGHLPPQAPAHPPFAYPIPAPLEDPALNPAQAPFADPVPVHGQPVFAPQPAPVSRVYVPVEKKVPVYVKVPYAVPKPYPVTVEKHVPVPYNKLVPYPVIQPFPVNKLVPYPVPQYAPPYKYVSKPYLYAPYHRVVLKKKCSKHVSI